MTYKSIDAFLFSIKEKSPEFFINRLILSIGPLDFFEGKSSLLEDCFQFRSDIYFNSSRDHHLFLDESIDVIVLKSTFKDVFDAQSIIIDTMRLLAPGGMMIVFFEQNKKENAKNILLNGLDKSSFSNFELSSIEESNEEVFWGTTKGKLSDASNFLFFKWVNHLLLLNRQLQSALDVDLQENQKINGVEEEKLLLLQQIHELQNEVKRLKSEKDFYSHLTAQVIGSNSWRLTSPLRMLMMPVKNLDFNRISTYAFRFLRGMKYITRGDFSGFFNRLRSIRRNRLIVSASTSKRNWLVVTPPHTLSIATAIVDRLRFHGFTADVSQIIPSSDLIDFYIILGAPVFKHLPAPEKTIIYQLEQSVSSRWFTEKYIYQLQNCFAVLDYAMKNFPFLAANGINFPHLYYLPVAVSESNLEENNNLSSSKDYVLFYGDYKSCLRRQRMLEELKSHVNLRCIDNIFGNDLIPLIRNARLVINLHYYENALLELPRIQECLSLGVSVVSENSSDQDCYPELIGVVEFFETGSIFSMIQVVKKNYQNPPSREKILDAYRQGKKRFDFFFDRFLIGAGFVDSAAAGNTVLCLPHIETPVCLSLPETFLRRKAFAQVMPSNYVYFDGFRRFPSWVGCGLSYRETIRHAQKNNWDSILIMEDDVLLPDDYEKKIGTIKEYLSTREEGWDVFSGIMAIVDESTEILAVHSYGGMTFVTINRLMSMVFNLYNRSIFDILSQWDCKDFSDATNTIDRYLHHKNNLKVVVTLPFFVDHREEVSSTLWGFKNTQYIDLIKKAEKKLAQLVETFKKSNASVVCETVKL